MQALELGDNYIGTEHLVIGLPAAKHGLAGDVLRDLGITREAIVAELTVAAHATTL
ncbi:MAG: Clp protease N-terminal domain-containing protein [Actinomycetota bacterium]|nr:Clp protease N-terminal domain-containing protein [Actinomycetota bacterium]